MLDVLEELCHQEQPGTLATSGKEDPSWLTEKTIRKAGFYFFKTHPTAEELQSIYDKLYVIETLPYLDSSALGTEADIVLKRPLLHGKTATAVLHAFRISSARILFCRWKPTDTSGFQRRARPLFFYRITDCRAARCYERSPKKVIPIFGSPKHVMLPILPTQLVGE